jgi:peptidyl-prolyl cis-trans isomerase C
VDGEISNICGGLDAEDFCGVRGHSSVARLRKKPEGQSVAIVNGEEITVPQLNAQLAAADASPGVDKNQARSRALQALIDRVLLEQQARSEGIDKSPTFLEKQRQLTQEVLIGMLAQRLGGTAQLPSDQDVAQFEESHPQMFAKREMWTLDEIRFQMPASGPIQQQINATHSLAALEDVLKANHIDYTPATARIDSAVVPQDLYGKIIALPAGEPFIVPVGADAVASVITAREAQPVSADQARSLAIAAIRKQQTAILLDNRLKTLRKSAKIQYQPGYAPPAS